MAAPHVPVLVEEVVHRLITKKDGIYVDGTVGAGGHSRALLQRLSPDAVLLGIDADAAMLDIAEERLRQFPQTVLLAEANFSQMETILRREGIEKMDGLLLDLGISSYQIDQPARGFSYQNEGPLNMRFSQTDEYTAAAFINTADEQDLLDVIRKYGEEKNARSIARSILQRRPMKTTSDLRQAVESVTPDRYRNKTLSRVFQAIRIYVNRELEVLERTLHSGIPLLNPAGRIVVISYHSLEDRIVKQMFREAEKDCVCPPELPTCVCEKEPTLRVLTRNVVRPSEGEVERNPRARSARLRSAERV